MLNWIHGRMSVGARLGLIAALLMVPMLTFAGLFVLAGLEDVRFAERELEGMHYIDAAFPAFDLDGSSDYPEFQAARTQYDSLFGVAEKSAAFDGATEGHARRSAGMDFFVAVADASGLTLDPDLDSFYAMDMVVIRLPALHNAISYLQETIDAPTAGAERSAALAVATDRLDTAWASLQSSANSMTAANAQAGEAIAPAMSSLPTVISAFHLVGEAGAGTASEAEFDRHADALWEAASSELERLLNARISRLETSLATWLGLAATILVVALALMALISSAMSSRIGSLVSAMKKLAADDDKVTIPCQNDKNETGEIAKALLVFKESLIERQRMRAEAATMHEQTAERLRDMENKHAQATQDLASVISYTKNGLAKLYEGDLTFRLKEFFPVDFKSIRMDFNQTAERLEETMRTILEASESMRGTANEISTAADDLSHRTEQQAAGLEQTAAALEQITVTVKRNAGNANRMREVATEAGNDAQTSGDVLKRTVQAMAKIERSSNEIARILGVIDEISFQTNLLALNAGVEAARAGEAGRGFAVVASEVRALAQRSADAAKEIKELINTSSTDVETGVKLVGQTAAALERIAGRVGEINDLVGTVASASEEEARGVTEVNAAVNQMDQITQQNAAMVEQSTAASHSLAHEAQSLADLVRTFRVSKGANATLRLAS